MTEAIYHISLHQGATMPLLLEQFIQEGVEHWENWTAFPCLISGILTSDQAQKISNLPYVKEVVEETTLQASARNLLPDVWGVDRIDQRIGELDQTYSATPRGQGVRVFVVDSGIRMDHIELQGRMAANGQHWDFERPSNDPLVGWPATGDHHGTHLASVIAGKTLGVAPKATLHSIRVADSRDVIYPTNVIAGLQAALTLHQSLGGPSVINLSLNGEGRLSVFDNVMATLIQAGITVVVSAGNNSDRAYNYWPASAGTRTTSQGTYQVISARKPISVGSIGKSIVVQNQRRDPMSSTSNWGYAVDVLAPGEAILGATTQDSTATGLMSGTSVAAAHVTGVVALYLESENNLTPTEVRQAILNRATNGLAIYTDTQDPTPNRIVNTWWMPNTFEWKTPAQDFSLNIMEATSQIITLEAECKIAGYNEDVVYTLSNLRAASGFTLPEGISWTSSVRRINGSTPYQYALVLDVNLRVPNVDSNQKFLLDLQVSNQRNSTLTRTLEVQILNATRAPVWELPLARELDSAGNPRILLDITQDETIETQVFRAVDPDGLEVSYEIIAGVLPEGLIFKDGELSGKPGVLPKDILLYELIIRAKNIYGVSSDTTIWIRPVDLNLTHSWRSEWLAQYTTESAPLVLGGNVNSVDLGDLPIGVPIHLLMELENPDRDTLTFQLLGAGVNNPDQETLLPVGLQLIDQGTIEGVASLDNPIGKYYFRVKVTDASNSGQPSTENVVFHFNLITNDNVNTAPTDFVIWETPEGNLGSVYETHRCHLGVKARSPGGGQITYRLAPGLQNRLPAGLSIDQITGEIRGVVPFKTFQTNPSFVVRAQVGTAISDRKFSFDILDLYSTNMVMDVVGDLGGLARGKLTEWIQGVANIDDRLIFRPEDRLWGRVRLPKLYIVSGLKALHHLDSVNSQLFHEQLRDYHYQLNLRFATMKTARANSPDGTWIYDVIYFQIEDPMKKAGGWDGLNREVELDYSRPPLEVPEWNLDAGNRRFFPNSLMNIRRDLIVNDQEARTPWTREINEQTIVVESDYSGEWETVHYTVESSGEQEIRNDNFLGRTPKELVVLKDEKIIPPSLYTVEDDRVLITADAGNQINIFPRRRGVGLAGNEGLPLWMTTEQIPGDITSIPGYVPAVEILYCQPGKGARVLAQLEAAGINSIFQGQPFTVDRYLVNGYGIQRDGEIGSSGGLPTTFNTTLWDNGLTYEYDTYHNVYLNTSSFVIQLLPTVINRVIGVERIRGEDRETLTEVRLEVDRVLIDEPLLAGDVVVLVLDQNGQATLYDDALNTGSDALTDDGKYYKFPKR